MRRRRNLIAGVAAGAMLLATVTIGAGPGSVLASPYPVDAAHDPRIPANCPGGYGDDGAGGTTWCRISGLTLDPTNTGPRFAGQYAILYDLNGDGGYSGDELFYVWCAEDAGSHPATTYPAGAAIPGDQLAVITGTFPHPEGVAMLTHATGISEDATRASEVPGDPSGITYSRDEWAAAVWAINHWTIGDTTALGAVVVSDLADPFAAGASEDRVEALISEIQAYSADMANADINVNITDFEVRSSMTIVITGVSDGGWRTVVAGNIASSSNLRWANGDPFTGSTFGHPNADYDPVTKTATLHVIPIDIHQPVSLTVTREWPATSSWLGFPVGGGQQSTTAYYRPGNIFLDGSDAVAPAAEDPRISSVATDSADGDKTIFPMAASRDTISLTRLTVGNSYTLHAQLFDTVSLSNVGPRLTETFTAVTADEVHYAQTAVTAGNAGHRVVWILWLDDNTLGIANIIEPTSIDDPRVVEMWCRTRPRRICARASRVTAPPG